MTFDSDNKESENTKSVSKLDEKSTSAGKKNEESREWSNISNIKGLKNT
jgi:hypothetical protein